MRGEALFFLIRRSDRWELREKVELLSLSFLLLSLCPFLSFLSSYRIVWSKVKFGEYFLPHVNTPLAPWITLITLSIYLGFLSNVLPHVSYGSHLSSLFDLPCTWHVALFEPLIMCQVSHITLDASKNVKFRLSRNSTKFNVVARFRETIPTVKSVLSSEI